MLLMVIMCLIPFSLTLWYVFSRQRKLPQQVFTLYSRSIHMYNVLCTSDALVSAPGREVVQRPARCPRPLGPPSRPLRLWPLPPPSRPWGRLQRPLPPTTCGDPGLDGPRGGGRIPGHLVVVLLIRGTEGGRLRGRNGALGDGHREEAVRRTRL